MAEDKKLKCVSRDCERDAVVYCTVCKQMICETHQKIHDAFSNTLPSPHEVISLDDYHRKTSVENSRLCDVHKQSMIMAGCEFCYKPICLKCLDDRTPEASACPVYGKEKHSTRSVEEVTLKIQAEMKEMLSELRIKELTHADDMKVRRKTYDEDMEDNRADLDKLSIAVQQLHKELDELADEMRNGMVAHMNLKNDIMKKCESDYSEYQENCQEIHNQISEFFKLEPAVVLKDQQMLRDRLEPLKSLQLVHQLIPPKLSIQRFKLKDGEQLNIPIQLIENPATVSNTKGAPMSLEHGESININRHATVLGVPYLQDGHLVYVGRNSQLVGLDYTQDLPEGIIISLCEHNNNLYVLQQVNWNKMLHVHIIGQNCPVRRSVICSPGIAEFQQLAVNDNYVIFTAGTYEAPTVKVYSAQTSNILYDIKPVRSGWIWGKDFLNDTLVVGDFENTKVINISLGSRSTVIWSCSIHYPSITRIKVCSQVILVGDHLGKTHILSHQGDMLSTIVAPRNKGWMAQVCRFGKLLATADRNDSKVHIYKFTVK